MIVEEEDYLAHYGILRKSGRYPWGSGGTQSARNRTFLGMVEDLKKNGMSEADIAKGFGITTNQLRAARSIAVNQQRQEKINQAQRLRDRGWGYTAIGERMGINESSVRALLAPGAKDKTDILQNTADMLKRQVEQKQFVDVGESVEKDLPLGDNPGARIGISSTKFRTALALLQEEGYQVHTVKIPQLGTGELTTVKVLAKPGVSQKEVWQNRDKIQSLAEYSDDGGRSYSPLRRPTSISSKRIDVVYAENGGSEKDGLIEIRPGAKDLDLGAARYAQVRIAVDDSHYLKGMAVYNDKLPPGVDVRFNTNKKNSGNKLDAMKEMEKTPSGKPNLDNPFTASIKPGGQRGALNIVYEEGDWDKFSKSLPSQMLSKQSPELAQSQLGVTYDRRMREFDEIKALTNPVVRQRLLESFSDSADSAAVHLAAAAMPRQATKVLLPISSMKPTEIHAPSFKNGDRVALVRFPHGGTFEIPELTVNNRNPEARRLLGSNATDAVGIHHKVAERLSGADFDGDYVLVIPNNRGSVKSTPPLDGLKGFDPKAAYPAYEGMTRISPDKMQFEMGNVSNLITDMTIKGASTAELARAVRHSMVVIDSEKHNLDWRASERDNGIPALKERYQGKKNAGAATLISRATSPQYINERKPRPASEGGPIDKATGKRVFVDTGRTRIGKSGEPVVVKKPVAKLAVAEDAHSLVSQPTGTHIERIYADHSNKLKALANDARKEMVNTPSLRYSPSAKKVYANEVSSLISKLTIAEKNAPRERQAQVLGNAIYSQVRRANPNMDKDQQKKAKFQALAEARSRVGAKKDQIDITPKEWEAIQSGAISNHMLSRILRNADVEKVKQLATPREMIKMTATATSRAKQMLASGYTQAEVAEALGVSLTTLKTSINE